MRGDRTCSRWTRLCAGAACIAALAASVPAAAQWTGTWTPLAVAQSVTGQPHARSWTELIFDPVAGKPALFGGSGGTYRNDILHLDVANLRWLDIEPQVFNVQSPYGPPCSRDEHTLAYDPVNALYWTFGGSGYACAQRSGTAGAGTTTTRIVDPTLPAATVDFYRDYWVTVVIGSIVYRAVVAAYDPAAKALTLNVSVPSLQSGRAYTIGSQYGGGTWNYSPSTRQWYGFDAPGFGYTGPKPGSRLSPTLAYSSADRALVMFGGATNNDVWALDVDTKTWMRLIPDGQPGSPYRRAQLINAFAYDPVNDLFVLFGGRCNEGTSCGGIPYNGALGDTWIYRLSTNTWTQVFPPQSPPARIQHSLVYDPVYGVMVLFGGYQGALRFEDVWVYDVVGNTWTQVALTGTPGTRHLHMMVHDPSSGQHILYGGLNASGNTVPSVHALRLARRCCSLAPLPSFTAAPATVTLGTPVNFDAAASSAPDGSIVSYAWDFGDSAGGTGVTASRTYAAPGSYTVRLTVTDNGGASASTTRDVTVNPAAAPSDILYSKKIGGTVTNGGSVTSVLANGSPVAFTNLGGGAYEFTLTVTATTSLTVTVTAVGPGGPTVETIVVTVP